ncbi:hypothetical protein PI126_g16953 [Phytophthora idaei]|nr:hypothetical protein PI126_g16953 [Phytophthora idaei]
MMFLVVVTPSATVSGTARLDCGHLLCTNQQNGRAKTDLLARWSFRLSTSTGCVPPGTLPDGYTVHQNGLAIEQVRNSPARQLKPTCGAAVVAACEDGWNMCIKLHLANSLDCNANDLFFVVVFASIQSLEYKKKARTIENLVDNVEEAYNELDYSTLDRVFVTLQSVLHASMDVDGSNEYAIPHLAKERLRTSNGILPPPPSLSYNSIVFDKAIIFSSSVEDDQVGSNRT